MAVTSLRGQRDTPERWRQARGFGPLGFPAKGAAWADGAQGDVCSEGQFTAPVAPGGTPVTAIRTYFAVLPKGRGVPDVQA